jgi:thioredoxin-related protein
LPLDEAWFRRQRCPANQRTIMKFTSIACAATLALTGFSLAGGEGWTADFAAAKKQATEENKDLLMDFTGSDWCGWCIKLKDEVFQHDEFKNGVKDTFVLVEIDFPKDKSKLSEETQKQNQELGGKYGIEGYPTIMLTDASGRPYAATGYQPGGPEKYVTHLNELRGRKTLRDEAFAAAEKLEGPEKAKALIDALGKLELSESTVSNHYPDVVEQIKAADPEDTTGFAKNLANRQRIADFQNELQALAEKQDMAGAMALVNKTLADGGFETEETLQLMMTRAIIFAEQGKFDEALKAVDAAKAFAPESPLIPGIEQFRERLEESSKKKDEGEKQEG